MTKLLPCPLHSAANERNRTDLQEVESQIREARVRSERRARKAGAGAAAESTGADQGLEQLQDQRRQLMVKLDVAERKVRGSRIVVQIISYMEVPLLLLFWALL